MMGLMFESTALFPGGGGVDGEEAPVDEPPVAQVGVVAVLRGEAEHRLHHLLRLRRPLQEQLHRRRQQLQLHLGILVLDDRETCSRRTYSSSHD